ncbi:hypothetical protein NQZ68_007186, partial [Dissostichus eleginoides]
MCRGKNILLSLQTPSSLLAAVLSVAPSGPQLKTIKIRWNFLLTIPLRFDSNEELSRLNLVLPLQLANIAGRLRKFAAQCEVW